MAAMNNRLLRPRAAAVIVPEPPSPPVASSLLMQFDSGFLDDSPNALSPMEATASLNTANKRFGAASASFNGGHTVRFTSHPAINLTGEVPYTIEFWLWVQSQTGNYQTFLTRRFNVNWQYLFGFSNPSTRHLSFSATSQGAGVPPGYSGVVSPQEIPLQQWMHVAGIVDNGQAKLFVDGKLVASGPWAIQPDNGADLFLGQQGSYGEWFHGQIDGLRITRGLAVYAGPFEPPSAPPAVDAARVPTVPAITGCLDPAAINYSPGANVAAACQYPCPEYGTGLRNECVDCDWGTVYADGDCGEYFEVDAPGECCGG